MDESRHAQRVFGDVRVLIRVTLRHPGALASGGQLNYVFLASGAGIKPGVKLGLVENIDLAPTIAHLLGQKLPAADGRVLREMLED